MHVHSLAVRADASMCGLQFFYKSAIEKELRLPAPNGFCFIVLLNIGAKRTET
jgi:hypothetical protein